MPINENVKTAIGILLASIVIAFICAVALGIFVDLFFSADPKPSEAFRGAFLGAFFAFLFVRLSDFFGKLYDRQTKARHALIALQHKFQEILNVLHDNIYVGQEMMKFREALRTQQVTPIWYSRLATVPTFGDSLLPLTNIDLINELLVRSGDIRKLNDSQATTQNGMDQVITAYTNKQINDATYRENAMSACQHVEELMKYSEALKEDLVYSLATVRILCRQDVFVNRLITWAVVRHYPSDISEKVLAEIKKMAGEQDRKSDSNVELYRAKRSRGGPA